MTVVELEAGAKFTDTEATQNSERLNLLNFWKTEPKTSRKSKTIARKESIRREKNHSPFLLKKKRKIERLKKKLRTIKQSSKRTKRKKTLSK